jgi:hypothetical protein
VTRFFPTLVGALCLLALSATEAGASGRLLGQLGCYSNTAVSGCVTLPGIDGPGR